MTKRIFRGVFLTSLGALALALALITGVMYGQVDAAERRQLADIARLNARGVEQSGAAWFTAFDAGECRITWIAATGEVLFDSTADAGMMENHLSREEVRAALSTGSGESARYSDTLMDKTFYTALRLADGSVVRASIARTSALSLLVNTLGAALLIAACVLSISYLFARSLSKRITQPLNQLNLDAPLKADAYEELAPLLTRIEAQQLEIEARRAELARKREEFDILTGSMSEGLIFLNLDGVILSVNKAAARLFSADADCVGRHMLSVERSTGMQRLLASALGGRRAEDTFALAGGLWRAEASPVYALTRVAGACLLFTEVTQREKLEQMRREFSANVTHELKTPLQTILGCAELMENGMVKHKDEREFIRRIRAEAARLGKLIDDILRLSRLDEGGAFESEWLCLNDIAREAAAACVEEARQLGVTLSMELDEIAHIYGVRRLVYDIAYNLTDNAVRYNKPGGSVCVYAEAGEKEARLIVEDTGIGIPEEHQARVFERFYRVDKSHSRATGGTGLGLSIVKHAAQYMSADIALESAAGRGTRVTITFLGKRA